ncbi:UNVERIFIED_CONTAM: ABC-type multidrug transport system fused ATPase/permease subunit [Paenibacillus sp. PvR008]
MKNSRINFHLNESIQGIRVTQAYTQEQENMAYFDNMNSSSKRSWDKASAMNQVFGPLIDITGGLGTLVLFWVGAHLIQTDQLTVGLLVAMASSERIFEFMDEQPNIANKPGAKDLPSIRGGSIHCACRAYRIW